MIGLIVKGVVVVIGLAVVVRQVRKPIRWIGAPFLRAMNASHSALTDWGLGHVRIDPGWSILDVGCGGGRTIAKMAATATGGKVFGVDYAAESVRVASALNAAEIRAGRVEIRQASVSHLPFPDATFDLVTAIETHYYWPDLGHDVGEIRRVLKPGGTLLVIAESFKGGRNDLVEGPVMKLLGATRLTVDGHRELLTAAGFGDVQVLEERRHGWLAALGKRPAAVPAEFSPAEP
ncbi:MAG: class I SAM-dependent methyltransferase [Candidatus Eisenbacteria bacterium]